MDKLTPKTSPINGVGQSLATPLALSFPGLAHHHLTTMALTTRETILQYPWFSRKQIPPAGGSRRKRMAKP